MPKVGNLKKTSTSCNVLHMAFPDAKTLDFWKRTSDDPREVASRIARFSRLVGKHGAMNSVRASELQETPLATQSQRSAAPGRLLLTPSDAGLGSNQAVQSNARRKIMKAPGVQARKGGTKLQRGKALQVMTYPRNKTKRVLVEASRETGLALSSFMVLAALREAAALRACAVSDLVPPEELRGYRRSRVVRKRSAAKRGTRIER